MEGKKDGGREQIGSRKKEGRIGKVMVERKKGDRKERRVRENRRVE